MKSKITIVIKIDDEENFKDVSIDSSDKMTRGDLILACVHLMLLVTQESNMEFEETLNRLVEAAKSARKPNTLN